MLSAAARESQFKVWPYHSVPSYSCTVWMQQFALVRRTCTCFWQQKPVQWSVYIRIIYARSHLMFTGNFPLQLSTVCAVFKADRKWRVWRTGWRGPLASSPSVIHVSVDLFSIQAKIKWKRNETCWHFAGIFHNRSAVSRPELSCLKHSLCSSKCCSHPKRQEVLQESICADFHNP